MARVPVAESVSVGVAANAAAPVSYVDWPAIFAGTVVAAAIIFVLSSFGTAIGLTLVSPYEGEGFGPVGLLIAMGLWSIWVTVSGFMAGGYLAGRLRRRAHDASEHESDVRDGSHGLVVWALGIIVGATLIAGGSLATAHIGTQAASAVASAAPEDAAELPFQYMGDTLLRADGTATVADPATRDEVVRILGTATNDDGISSDDRVYLTSLVAATAGVPPETAATRVDTAIERIDTLKAEAQAAAEAARKASILAAFVLAASLAIGAAGAWWSAQTGGRHRDEGVVFAQWGRRTV